MPWATHQHGREATLTMIIANAVASATPARDPLRPFSSGDADPGRPCAPGSRPARQRGSRYASALLATPHRRRGVSATRSSESGGDCSLPPRLAAPQPAAFPRCRQSCYDRSRIVRGSAVHRGPGPASSLPDALNARMAHARGCQRAASGSAGSDLVTRRRAAIYSCRRDHALRRSTSLHGASAHHHGD